MTVPATARRAGPYNGNGSTTSFSFNFKTFANGDLQVTKMDALGVETTLVLNSDYSVTLNPDQDTSPGGSITYPISGSPLATGQRLTIIGDLDYEQTTDLLGGGAFNARVIEDTFDRTVIQIQQLEERLDRALLVPVNSTANVQLPNPESNQLIGWDSGASALQNYALSELATGIAYGTFRYDTFAGDGATTQFTLSDNPGTVGNLDVAISGVVQVPGTDYSLTSGVLVFTSAPANGTTILARYGEAMTSAPGDAADISFHPAGTGAATRTVQSRLRDSISVFDFMSAAQVAAVQNNDYSVVTGAQITAACQAALTAAAGRTLLFPAGTYVITSTLTAYPTTFTGIFGPGMQIIGDGMLKTFFDNRVANGPMLVLDTATHTPGAYKAQMGARLSNFMIMTTTSPANSTGIRIVNAYEVLISQVYIKGMTLDGIEMANGLFVDDGWNMVTVSQCWLDTCARWGIKADGTAGRNEGSYTYLHEVFFQTCGTTSAAATPPSGGMIWKGQVLVMESSGFANGNENVGLFIKGESGLGLQVDLRNTTFENCKKRSLYVTGVMNFKGRNIQFYNNNTYISTVACEFDGASFIVRQVDIDGVQVRASNLNNPYTAFKISGANAELNSCRVRNVNWDNFDYTGQTRFDGWQFDPIPTDQYILQVPSSAEVYLRPNQTIGKGNKVPLRLRGGGGGTPSSTGEWIAARLSNAGLYLNPASFAIGTRYYVYLYDNNGTPTLEADSVNAWTNDTTHGYAVKSTDATRYYVGSVVGGASAGTVATSGTGWLNPMQIPGTQGGVPVYIWADSSGRLRIANTAPTADTSGTVVGTQL